MDIFEILENIELEESAKTDFIAKFGEDTYNNFVKAKQRLANAGLSVDFGQYLKKSKEEVDDILLSLYDDEEDNKTKNEVIDYLNAKLANVKMNEDNIENAIFNVEHIDKIVYGKLNTKIYFNKAK